MDENKRLSDLTRMLLSSPSFSNFLERMSTDPSQLPQASAQMEQQQPRQAPKDVNPYAAQQQMQRQQIAMMPEQHMDFSSMGGDAEAYNFQPQVYAVLETPETPLNIDTAALSGKTSNFVGSFESDNEKVEMPVIEQPPKIEEMTTAPKAIEAEVVDDEFENDPEFALYHQSSSAPSTATTTPTEIDADIFGGIQSEKFLAHYELLDASEEEQKNAITMASVQRRMASLESVCARLEALTADI